MKRWMVCWMALVAMWGSAGAEEADREIRRLKSEVSTLESQVRRLERDLNGLESEVHSLESKIGDAGIVLVFFAVFCAWWAQYSGRNPWLWFFLGLFFHLITAFVLLSKNAEDRRKNAGSWRLGER